MSWDQGIQLREDLPPKFVEWADKQKCAPLEYITWFGLGEEVFLDYGEAGSLKLRMKRGESAPQSPHAFCPSPDKSGTDGQDREASK